MYTIHEFKINGNETTVKGVMRTCERRLACVKRSRKGDMQNTYDMERQRRLAEERMSCNGKRGEGEKYGKQGKRKKVPMMM